MSVEPTLDLRSTHAEVEAKAPMARRPILAATGVCKVYRTRAVEVTALRDVHLTVEEGDFVAVMGPSGSGKTTLLKDVRRGQSVPSRYYVKADDPTAQVNAIRSRFIGSGADAEAVRTRVEGILSQNSGFFTLMQQFVGIGLIVGIAGIGCLAGSSRSRTAPRHVMALWPARRAAGIHPAVALRSAD